MNFRDTKVVVKFLLNYVYMFGAAACWFVAHKMQIPVAFQLMMVAGIFIALVKTR